MGQATNESQRFGPFIIGEKLGNGGMNSAMAVWPWFTKHFIRKPSALLP